MRALTYVTVGALLACAAPADAARSVSARVDSLLSAASDTTMAYEKRVRLIKKAIRNDDSGWAMHDLAELYNDERTPGSRRQASTWLQRAMRKDKKNMDFRIAYAKVLWGLGRRGHAYKNAKRAIDLDPSHVGALYLAGRYAAWQMSRYLEGERIDYQYDDRGYQRVRSFSLERFGEEDRDQAIGYLTRALAVDPNHRPSLLLLGLVYYEAQMPAKMAALFQEYLARHPDDPDAHLFLGLALQAQDELKRAYPAYVNGLQRMSFRERQFMMSVFMLVGKDSMEAGRDLPDEEALRAFWTGRDPLFLTPVNERLMEHCGRVAYANLRFGDPERGIAGWSTDKGQAYIRYGRPAARSVRPPEIDTGLDEPVWYQDHLYWLSQQGLAPYKHRPRLEMWNYGGIRLVFANTDSRDTWRYRVGWVGRQPVDFDALTTRVPEYYKDPYKWERYDAPYQMARFRGDGEVARVEIYYALPGEEVERGKAQAGAQSVAMRQGLFLFDANWDTLKKDVGRVEMMPWVQYGANRDGYLFASEKLTLAPGKYFIAAEAEDRKTKSIGTFRSVLRVETFGYDSLSVSDMLLARRIVEREHAPYGRERYLILPNPLKQYQQGAQAYFYYEIYNLQKDRFGATNYQVTYQIRTVKDDAAAADQEWTTAVSYTHKGSQAWEPIYQVLNLEMLPGPREFRVNVLDLNSRQEVSSATTFRVMW